MNKFIPRQLGRQGRIPEDALRNNPQEEKKINNFDKEIKELIEKLESYNIPYYISDESNLVCDEFVEQRFQLNMGNGDTHVIHFIEGDDYEGVCISSESSYYGDDYSIFYYLCDVEDEREFWLNIKGKRVYYIDLKFDIEE